MKGFFKQLERTKQIAKKIYSFRKPKRETCISEQVGPIFISDTKEELEWDDLKQHQKRPSQQRQLTQEQTPKKVRILNRKRSKRRIR